MLEKVHQKKPVINALVSFLRLTVVLSCRSKAYNFEKRINGKLDKNAVPLSVCCWNVRTLLDKTGSTRPERRTALVCKELKRLSVDIAALSETRLSGEDHLTEASSGYTIFWVGKMKGERREGGVGFAIRTNLLPMVELPTGISDRIMMLRVSLSGGRYLTILSVYAPTLQAQEETASVFYETLRTTLRSIPFDDKVLLIGDFNARVGKDFNTWDVIGRYGIGKMNSNGLLLLSLCTEFNLVVCNTFFRHKLIHKVTWTHPRSKHGHMIDFIITRKRDMRDVCSVRVLRSADCDTDHKLLRGKFKLVVRRKVRMSGIKMQKRINIDKLSGQGVSLSLKEHLDSLVFDGSWESLRDQLFAAGVKVLGFKTRKHKDWFDDNNLLIDQLLKERRRINDDILRANGENFSFLEKKLRQVKSNLQRELRKVKNAWWKGISSEIQVAFDAKNSKALYGLLRQVFGSSTSFVSPLKSKDQVTILKDSEKILCRWQEHFCSLFDNPSVVNFNVVRALSQRVLHTSMDDPPSHEEVLSAIFQINYGKAPGLDGIPIELLQVGSPNVLLAVSDLLLKCWSESLVPKDWVDGVLVTLYKGKGDKAVCDNYRGITLLEVVGKVLARLLLNRLHDKICSAVLPESQSGFRPGRGTTDMVFSARQVQEKCIEQHVPLYQVFVDLTKAFDTVNREALWVVLCKAGCPPKFVNMFKQLHNGMTSRVAFSGNLSEAFPVENGVKQGDVAAPTLFSIFFSALLTDAFQNCDKGILIEFRSTGRVFNLRRFSFQSKTCQAVVRELLYADDIVFMTHSEGDMQHVMNRFSASCSSFGLSINLAKTKIMYTPAPGETYIAPNIVVSGSRLADVETFVYLGSVLSRDGSLDAEIHLRIKKASVAFGSLEKRVWADRGLTRSAKISVYKACVVSVLLYSCECWTLHRRHIKLLERLHQRCLRRILNIKYHLKIPDAEVLALASCVSVESMVMSSQMRWVGHVVRMEDFRIPKQLFYGQLKEGKRPSHKPRKRYKDNIKCNLKQMKIDERTWEDVAHIRPAWRESVKAGCSYFEANRVQHVQLKRALRKGSHVNLAGRTSAWSCGECNRVLLSKAGYVNHLKSHEKYLPACHQRPDDLTCVLCKLQCKSHSGLKRHLAVHKIRIEEPLFIPTEITSCICHLCHKMFRSVAGLKSHLRAHERRLQAQRMGEAIRDGTHL